MPVRPGPGVVEHPPRQLHGGHAARRDHLQHHLGLQRGLHRAVHQGADDTDLPQLALLGAQVGVDAHLGRPAERDAGVLALRGRLAHAPQGLQDEVALGGLGGVELHHCAGAHAQAGQGGAPGDHRSANRAPGWGAPCRPPPPPPASRATAPSWSGRTDRRSADRPCSAPETPQRSGSGLAECSKSHFPPPQYDRHDSDPAPVLALPVPTCQSVCTLAGTWSARRGPDLGVRSGVLVWRQRLRDHGHRERPTVRPGRTLGPAGAFGQPHRAAAAGARPDRGGHRRHRRRRRETPSRGSG